MQAMHPTVPPRFDRQTLVDSHAATLRIAAKHIDGADLPLPEPRDGIVEWTLNGARVRVENAGGDIRQDPSFGRCIPRLGYLTPELSAPLKPAVDDGDAAVASCIFEVTGGSLFGHRSPGGAAWALLESPTAGAPRVSITSFAGLRNEIRLHEGAEIAISNLGVVEKPDNIYDFYLHYTLAAAMPTEPPGLPTGESPAACVSNAHGHTWPPAFKSVGPGCSNSAYP